MRAVRREERVMIYDYDDVYILQDDEQPDPLYGMEIRTLTPNAITCLQAGKRIYFAVNDEYAVVLKLDIENQPS